MNQAEQLEIVHRVAAQFWEREPGQVADEVAGIQVIKCNSGKIMGIFPRFEDKPEVFFKIYFYDRGFNFESEGLTVANAMPQVEGVTVPKIVEILPDYRAILTEKKNWQDNRSDLQRFFVGSLKVNWFIVGRWLRAFHDTRVSHQNNDYFLRKKFQKIESHLHDLHSLFTGDQMAKMQRIIDQAKVYFDSTPVEWVISHGDFGLSNIQISESSLDIIDFEDCQIAPLEFDILNCLTRMEYVSYFPHRPSAYKIIRKQFLDGYDIQLLLSPGHDFLSLFIKLDIIETYYRRKQLSDTPFLRRMIFSFFEREYLIRLQHWLHKTS